MEMVDKFRPYKWAQEFFSKRKDKSSNERKMSGHFTLRWDDINKKFTVVCRYYQQPPIFHIYSSNTIQMVFVGKHMFPAFNVLMYQFTNAFVGKDRSKGVKVLNKNRVQQYLPDGTEIDVPYTPGMLFSEGNLVGHKQYKDEVRVTDAEKRKLAQRHIQKWRKVLSVSVKIGDVPKERNELLNIGIHNNNELFLNDPDGDLCYRLVRSVEFAAMDYNWNINAYTYNPKASVDNVVRYMTSVVYEARGVHSYVVQ